LLPVLLLSFGLGLYRLGYQAALGDDAFSLVIAGKSLSELVRLSANEPHPPLFYLLLWGWVRLAGDSEFAGRFVAVFWAVASVALTFGLGRRLLGPGGGALAALLLAVNPFFVNYEQQARMYTMVVALVLASTWYFARMLEGDGKGFESRRLQAAYVVTTLLAVATHFFAVFIVAAQNLVFLGWAVLGRHRLRVGTWFALQGLWGIAYLPWIVVAFPTLSTYQNELVSRVRLDEAYLRTLRAYAVGEGPAVGLEPAILIAVALLLAVGVLGCWRRPSWLLAYLLALPPLLVFVVSLLRPMYYERYMMVGLPAYALVLAAGVAALGRARRWLAPVGVAVPLAVSLFVLPPYYAETRYATAADMRSMVAYLAALARPSALVVTNLPPSDPTFAYYYREQWPLFSLPETGDVSALVERLQGLAAGSAEIWYLPYGAERAVIEPWLDGHGVKVTDQWYSHARLVRYVFPDGVASWAPKDVDARFEQGIRLAGYALQPSAAESGQPLVLRLDWQADVAVGRAYKVFVHLMDGQERLWGQQDSEPGGGLRPTTSWQPGNAISDTYGLLVLPGTPPDSYRLAVGLYDATTGVRLRLLDGSDRLLLGEVQVAKSSGVLVAAAYRIQESRDIRVLPGLSAVGVNVERLGTDGPVAQFQPGQVVHVTLFWRAEAEVQEGAVRLTLTRADGSVVAAHEDSLFTGAYPPSAWRTGEIVRDQAYLFLPGDTPAGEYRLTLSAGGAEHTVATLRVVTP
jgi:4-amino-4-deoxy-L-arabinose transferase-like glycosyltransferase